jgi:hypothetical protein
MSKTPEELAEEYADSCLTTNAYTLSKKGFLAGYKVAQEHAHAALEEAEARIQELQDQIAGVSKAMPQWISVKDRLPEENLGLLLVYNSRLKKIGTSYWSEGIWCGGTWPVTSQFITYWMPIPELPKEEK